MRMLRLWDERELDSSLYILKQYYMPLIIKRKAKCQCSAHSALAFFASTNPSLVVQQSPLEDVDLQWLYPLI